MSSRGQKNKPITIYYNKRWNAKQAKTKTDANKRHAKKKALKKKY